MIPARSASSTARNTVATSGLPATAANGKSHDRATKPCRGSSPANTAQRSESRIPRKSTHAGSSGSNLAISAGGGNVTMARTLPRVQTSPLGELKTHR